MKINWFVIHNKDHLGPFSEEVLVHLFEAGDIGKDSKVWQEGMEEAISFEEFLIRKDSNEVVEEIPDDDLPPDLPPDIPVAVREESKLNSKESTVKVEKISSSKAFSPVNEGRNSKSKVKVKEDRGQAAKILELSRSSKNSNSQQSEQVKKSSIQSKEISPKKPLFFQSFLAFLVLIILGGGYFYYKLNSVFTRPSKMSTSDYERLVTTAKSKVFASQFSFAVAADRTTIWMSTNIPYEGDIIVTLKSVYNKTLTNKEIEVTARGSLKNNLASFTDFTFVKGLSFIDGYYSIEVVTTQDLVIPFLYQFQSKRKTQFRYFTEILISNLNEDEFKDALRTKQAQSMNNDKNFWVELIQKYETIKSITLQIQDSLKKVFDESDGDWKFKVKRFEDDYKRNFGNFFTNFVIANDKSYEELKSKDFTDKLEIISNYTRLSRLAKSIGGQTMEILNELEVYDQKIAPVTIEDFKKQSLNRLQSIVDICDQKKLAIENRGI